MMDSWQSRWHVRRQSDGQTYGPYTAEEIDQHLYQGLLAENDLARSDDGRVQRVGQLVDPRSRSAPAPPPADPRATSTHVSGGTAAVPAWGPWSKASVWCGIAGLLFCPVVFGLIGIGLGVTAISRGEEAGGRAVAAAAMLTAASMLIGWAAWVTMGGFP